MQLRLLLFFLLAGPNLHAQPEVEKLKIELTKIEKRNSTFKNDSLRFHLLTRLATKSENWEVSRTYWQKALTIAEKRSWSAGRFEGYKGMGLLYRSKGSLLDAAEYFQRGLHLAEKERNLKYQIESYQALGVAYSSGGDFNKALVFHNNALRLIDTTNRLQYLNCLNEIGNTYFQEKDYKKALAYYKKCLRINNNPVDSLHQCWFLLNTGAAYQEINELDSSLSNFHKLFTFSKFLSREDSILTYSRLAQLYVQSDKPKAALEAGLMAYRTAGHSPSNSSGAIANQALSETYRLLGDWKSAFFHERAYRSFRDSIHFQEQRQKLEGLRIGYESEKRKTEVASLKGEMEEAKKANLLLWIGVALFGMLVVALVLFNSILRKRRRKIEFQKDEISKINNTLEQRVEERTAELRLANSELIRKNRDIQEALLRGQTIERQRVASELHDNLGGTLTAIQWYMESLLLSDAANNLKHEGYEDLYNMISRAYGEVRLLAHHMMPEVLNKEGLEMALRELAIPINKTKRLKLIVETTHVSPNLDSKQKFELYSVALELCTNILKHARATEAYLKLDKKDHEIVMSVTDNGIGMPVDKQQGSMGLKNIQSRLETIGGFCTVHSVANGGTTVLVHIPCSELLPELVETSDHKHVNIESPGH